MRFLKPNALKPFLFFLAGAVFTCFYFWLTSRYPDLTAKATLGPNAPISSLGFSPIMQVPEDAGFWQKVMIETINWAHTNKKGMTFAFFIGAFFLSMLPLLQYKRTGRGALDSLLGFIVGSPLGVCVNCAAPISKSMLAAGSSVQFSLAALITSPTMNIVVLMMAFTLFPAYLVILKIMLTVFFVLVLVPFGCRYMFADDVRAVHENLQETQHISHDNANDIPAMNIAAALFWSTKTYIKNFWYLLKVALPLMALAGFLGSLLSIALPWEQIQNIGAWESAHWLMGLMLLALGVFGAFLPSPISFDIVLSATLLQAGVPIHYVAVFLFTLGTFSIYAFFILWQSISLRAASYMYACTVVLGVIAGFLTYSMNAAEQVRIGEMVNQLVEKSADDRIAAPNAAVQNRAYNYADIKGDIVPFLPQPLAMDGVPSHLELAAQDFRAPQAAQGLFQKVDNMALGLHQSYEISALSFIPDALPYATTGIAAGDVHRDGWPDILMSMDNDLDSNLALYANINGEKFMRQTLPNIGSSALTGMIVDLNGDGWNDIILSTITGENTVMYNDNGDFLPQNMKPLPSVEGGMTVSIAAGDIEGDGNLDVFFGNWYAGPLYLNNPESRNFILRADDNGDFDKIILPGITGETLSGLFSDFDGDGILDLYVGNDFNNEPLSDQLFKGTNNGPFAGFERTAQDGLRGAASTMSIDSGDINNDLKTDYYIAQIAYIGQFERAMKEISARQIPYAGYCDRAGMQGAAMEKCEKEAQLKSAMAQATHYVSDACDDLTDEGDMKKCMIHYQSFVDHCGYFALNKFTTRKPKASQRYMDFCARIGRNRTPIKDGDLNNAVRSANISRSNVMLVAQDQTMNFEDQAKQSKTGYGSWSWNARIVDLDNDGWQDIFVVNGHTFPTTLSSNIFYRNTGGGVFEDETVSSGLESFASTSAYTVLDYNNDGIQDVITLPTDSDVEIYQGGAAANALRISLVDETAKNRSAIGTRVIIKYETPDGTTYQQMQELKGGGGFRSYNQPVLHFGLSTADQLRTLEIHWRDGTIDLMQATFMAGKHYQITRTRKN